MGTKVAFGAALGEGEGVEAGTKGAVVDWAGTGLGMRVVIWAGTGVGTRVVIWAGLVGARVASAAGTGV